MSTLDAETPRVELRTVVNTADEPRPVPELLILVNEVPNSPIERAVVKTWSDGDVPNFSDFRTLILEVPADEATYESYRQDLRFADLSGTTVVWVALASSSREVLSQITGTEALRFRAPINGANC